MNNFVIHEQYHKVQRLEHLRLALLHYDNVHNCRDMRERVQLHVSYARVHHRRYLEAKNPPANIFVDSIPEKHCPICGQFWMLHEHMPSSATEPPEISCPGDGYYEAHRANEPRHNQLGEQGYSSAHKY